MFGRFAPSGPLYESFLSALGREADADAYNTGMVRYPNDFVFYA